MCIVNVQDKSVMLSYAIGDSVAEIALKDLLRNGSRMFLNGCIIKESIILTLGSFKSIFFSPVRYLEEGLYCQGYY